MGSNELRNKTENISLVGTEWIYTQQAVSPFEVQKMGLENFINDVLSRIPFPDIPVVGSAIKYEESYREITDEHPWYCLSKPTEVLTTTNYPVEFIDARRAKKWTHEEAGATPVSSFGGAWVTNEFTLDNNATNIAFLAELLEDWEFHGKPTSGWRILFDGTTELDITNIVLSTRKITTAANGAGASIEIYTNRVKGSTTSCKHFTEAGLADYQAGGGKIAGALRRDKMQLIEGEFSNGQFGFSTNSGATGVFKTAGTAVSSSHAGQASAGVKIKFNSSDSVNSRTSTTNAGETQAKSATVFKYLFVGSYEA